MQTIRSEEITLYSCSEDKGVPVGSRYGPTVRNYYIIECCTQGAALHHINGKLYPLAAGEAIVFSPGDTVIHETVGTEPRYGYWCCLSAKSVEEVFQQAGISSDAPYIDTEAAKSVTELLRQLYATNRENDGGGEWRRKGILLTIIGEILRKTSAKEVGSVYVNRALGVMKTRYGDSITVSDVAREIGLERSYFSTLFRRETGHSPKEALTNLRLRRAAELLRDTELPVAEVASVCGFPPESFSRVFRAKMGMPPLAYRRSHKPPQDKLL